jgi:hypothetical protein
VKLPFAASVCMLLLALAATASASPVGVLGLGSDGDLNATLAALHFLPDPTSTAPGPPWDAAVNNTTTLVFNNLAPTQFSLLSCCGLIAASRTRF